MAEEGQLVDAAEAAGVDISTLAEQWEGIRELRNLLRASGSVVQSEPGKYHPSDNVAGVSCNKLALAPLLPMLRLGDQDDNEGPRFGMVSIPQLEEQSLNPTLAHVLV